MDKLHNTSGGFNDTELNELAVNPKNLPLSRRVVITVTPVANCDNAPLNWRTSTLDFLGKIGLVIGLAYLA